MSVNDQRTAPADVDFAVLEGEDERGATFVFGNEDHTLGNALRYCLMQQKETEFCGYSVPHPYEPKMNVRLQAKSGPVLTVLQQGLPNLTEVANIVDEHFLAALVKFETSKGSACEPKSPKKSRKERK